MFKPDIRWRSSGVLFAAVSAVGVCVILLWPAHLRGGSGAGTLSFHDNFDSGNLNLWQMPYPEDWKILSENGLHYLHMERARPPGVPRRPLQFARMKNANVGSFDLRVRLRRSTGASLIVVFNYVDTLHFYYVHLSHDPASVIDVHNGVFIVDGEPRRRIAGKNAPPALPDFSWHTVRLVRDVRSGSIKVFEDGQSQPLFTTVDRTFTCGELGL